MFTKKSTITVFFLFMLLNTCIIGQKEAVILYNSEPVKVELNEVGDILTFIGLVPTYMAGYTVVKNPSVSIEPSQVNVEPVFENVPKNADYMILSDERMLLEYKPNFATLDSKVIKELNIVASKMRKDPNVNILVSAHYSDDTNSKQTLADNRLQSIISYLKIKGVAENRIRTEKLSSTALEDSVAINYLQ